MLQNNKVLIVEDDRCLFNAITRSLRQVNRVAKIEWVTTAEEAEERLKKTPVDLIIADQTLCGFKTGIDLWEYCQLSYPKIPFVMISGLPVSEFLTKLAPKNSPPFLPKPFSISEFSQLVEEFLK